MFVVPLFTTVTTEGALLPPDILQRVTDGDSDLGGIHPEAYHLYGERLNEATNRAWTRLQGAWQAFKSAQAKLPDDDLGTTLTRERWLLVLFNALDYGRLDTATAVDIDGKSYAISHRYKDVPIHLLSYKVELDKRTPGVAGAATGSPHSMMQVFLNRKDEHLWGILSNGYRLRILRDNLSLTRQAYIEFDLEAMMEGDVYSDFVLLYLLCHQSRVEQENPNDYWLEQWRKAAEEQGKRALEDLRGGVEQAINCLGEGFLDHVQNTDLRDALTDGSFDKQDYYRELLRLVYRLLFLFVAEDRDLLHTPDATDAQRDLFQHYSTNKLRDLSANLRGTRHHDLYESLRLVMRLLGAEREGAEGLGLPVLGSFLFSDKAMPHLIHAKIANHYLLDAIRAISTVEDHEIRRLRRVDFKNLGSEELGSVYESLLELHPDINIPNKSFNLMTAGGNERKTTGSYYTPSSLINALLDSALDPVLDEAVRSPHPKSFSQGAKDLLRRGTKDAELYENIASKAMVQISRNLRQRQTPTEEIMWEALRNRRLNDLKFRRQHPIANTNYVVDFMCYDAKLIVEIDGGIHEGQQQADEKRQTDIEALGYRVLRFSNDDVYNDLQWVLATIAHASKLPSTLGRGAGGEGTRQAIEARILDLKICDPACGSGHFLIAAANRMAKRLAGIRTGEDEPTPEAVTTAKRDVISHCIYGVDINPMAVELCKVNLWLEALEPGKPLTFLDHRIQVGNSLLGTTPKLMADGIPDNAFKAIEGDDKKFVSEMKKINKKERKQREAGVKQLGLFDNTPPPADYGYLTSAMHQLDSTPDDTLAGIRHKEQQYAQLANDPEYIKARLLADAWCSAFVWEKKSPPKNNSDTQTEDNYFPLPMTDLLYRRMEENPLADNLQATRETVVALTDRYGFFHWHVAFPDVFSVPEDVTQADNEQTGWHGGFDCVLGNPPWDQIQLDDREFFAVSAPDIANATNMTARKKMIKKLADANPYLYSEYQQALRANDGVKHFAHASGRYPYTSFGRLNTAPLFCESSLTIINPRGYSALIVPTGIATDSFNQYFFNYIVNNRALVSLYDFENKEGLFPAVHREQKFCLLSLSGTEQHVDDIKFVFFAHDPGYLHEMKFVLSPEDIAMMNPNTHTTPIFKTKPDAKLTQSIYRRVPVLILEDDDINPWNIDFQLMFMMNTASDEFYTYDELQLENFLLEDNKFISSSEIYLPLFEGKLTYIYDHRASTFEGKSDDRLRETLLHEHISSDFVAIPRYWLKEKTFEDATNDAGNRNYWLTFHDIANTNNERTFIATICPRLPLANTLPVIHLRQAKSSNVSAFYANLNALIFDYVSRLKISSRHFNFYIVKQLPVIPPHTYTQELIDFIVPRVLELSYTAWDLQPFAQDVGYQGAPFVWDEERRFLMRCELDALYFHLYQIGREDVDYIMETFPIVKRKDIAGMLNDTHPGLPHIGVYRTPSPGEEASDDEHLYVTKRIILDMYDQMAELPTMAVPAPKDESTTYDVPDVSQWETWLSPPPADPSVAHGE